MIITEKDKKIIYRPEDDDLTQEQSNELLKNNNFTKQLLKESNIQSEIKAIIKQSLINNKQLDIN